MRGKDRKLKPPLVIFAILGRTLCRASDEVIVIRGLGVRSTQEIFAILECILFRASKGGLEGREPQEYVGILWYTYAYFLNCFVSANYAMCTPVAWLQLAKATQTLGRPLPISKVKIR